MRFRQALHAHRTRQFRASLLGSTLLVSATLGGGAIAWAQDSTSTVQEVVVTGSRIRQPNITSTSPLTTVNSQDIQLSGNTNIEDLLNELPQVVAQQNNTAGLGSNGTATVNLRNLSSGTSARTLVLVDGRRLEPGDPSNGGAADINNIPSALVDRVDVVTGGASAVYGSDAIAGVVNFILKKNVQGVALDVQVNGFNHQQDNAQADHALATAPYFSGPVAKPGDAGFDGQTYDITATFGSNLKDDKGNITAYVNYRHLDPVTDAARDYSICQIGTDTSTFTTHYCSGSSNTPYGRFDNTGPINPASGRGSISVLDNPNGTNTFIPLNSLASAYNTDPLTYLQREDDTYRAGFFAHYTVARQLELYSDFMFMDDNSDAQVAPSGFFSGTGPNGATGFSFNCNNPFIGAAQAAALCPGAVVTPGAARGAMTTQSIRYRFANVPRELDFRHTDYKIDIGARGDLGDGWSYDAYLQYGIANVLDKETGYFSKIKLQNALNVVNVNGAPQCTVGTATGCVPLNIFVGSSAAFTPAAISYLLTPGIETSDQIEQVANATITGDLGRYGVKSPYAANGVGVAFGTEYRRESISITQDAELQSGDLAGTAGPAGNSNGSFDVYEFFGEARVPLVSDLQWVKDLSTDFGYRYSDYSEAGSTNTYKAEANYAPLDDARFRFSYNHAVRAPSAIELYAAQLPGEAGFQDPCSGAHPSFTAAQCQATGLNPALYGSINPCAAAQCDILTGGNPALKPEVADTFSVGSVFTPRFLRTFTASIDYFNINIEHVIGSGATPGTILNLCADGDSSDCALIHRDAQGTISSTQGYVLQINQNAGSLATRGVDLTAAYRFSFADLPISYVRSVPGSLAFNLVSTYTENFIYQPLPGSGHYDCAGLFGTKCGEPQPHWKGQLRTTWVLPWNLNVSLNWRYIGGVKFDGNQASPFLRNAFYDAADAKIGDYNYFDLVAQWTYQKRFKVRAGVNNLFDKDPPLVDQSNLGVEGPTNFGNGNTFPGVYDSLGRTLFASISAAF